jgi:prepilin-type N-terminal cleavage/methylation domain-containing protein
MRPTFTQRGLTLVETMVAMAVMVIGAMGMVGMSQQGMRLNLDGRRMTRAVAIAEDLVNQIQTWDYADPRLANRSPGNDADIGDAAQAFEAAGPPANVDHGEADLVLNGLDWNGIPAASLQVGGYERYWNVATPDDNNGNGVPDALRVAVIVRWPHGAGWRRIVFYVSKLNPDPLERL